ncbi:MAG: S9 family peptidase [Candidatus Marinimicrobia bacterium CG08_land_8_20_14_0_20_45_22]|nr:MAG: S9 family peptidase [Candidatus Marinimicrobia bacterium CG08_land_8_20_14_0_20_45_22]
MILMKFIILVLACAFSLNAQDSSRITIKSIVTDPGLARDASTSKNYCWTPDGKFVTYFGKEEKDQLSLIRMSADSARVDTVFRPKDLTFFDGTNNIALNANSAIWSPLMDKILLTGKDDIFIMSVKTKAIEKLTSDGKPKEDFQFSPDGNLISFIQSNNLWIIDLRTKIVSQLTADGNEKIWNGKPDWLYREEFDMSSGYKWSPNSKQIAFLQLNESNVNRIPLISYSGIYPEVNWKYYPKAGEKNPDVQVGVVNVADKSIIWMKPDASQKEYIPRFKWIPSTNRIALVTINRLQSSLKLFVGDPLTGTCELRLEEKESYYLNINELYYFFKDSSDFIWFSEKDGYMHLYLYDGKGNLKRQITQGNWCVTDLNAVDEKARKVYFTATKKSPLEKHLYSVSLDSARCEQIDSTDGCHDIVFSPTLKSYLDKYSTSEFPSKIYLTSVTGNVRRLIFENQDFNKDKYGFSTTKFVEIQALDGTTLYGSMLCPKNFDPSKKYPVLVYIYGGPGYQLVKNSFAGAWNQYLAQQGYIVFSVDNRGSANRGREFERKIYLSMGKFELQDQLDGIKYLKTLPYVDAKRIGIWGWSYGGYMTLYALAKRPDVFKTGIAVAPVTHWKYYDTAYTERYMGLPKDNSIGYFESSPFNYIDQIKANFLLVHGQADNNVNFQNSAMFIDELVKKGKSFEMMVYPNRDHGISDNEARIHLYEKMADFLKKNL